MSYLEVESWIFVQVEKFWLLVCYTALLVSVVKELALVESPMRETNR